jgi:hypothetical protein
MESHEKSLTLCLTQGMRDISAKVACTSFHPKCAKDLNDLRKFIINIRYYLSMITSIELKF